MPRRENVAVVISHRAKIPFIIILSMLTKPGNRLASLSRLEGNWNVYSSFLSCLLTVTVTPGSFIISYKFLTLRRNSLLSANAFADALMLPYNRTSAPHQREQRGRVSS
jgi:hypothetical protein